MVTEKHSSPPQTKSTGCHDNRSIINQSPEKTPRALRSQINKDFTREKTKSAGCHHDRSIKILPEKRPRALPSQQINKDFTREKGSSSAVCASRLPPHGTTIVHHHLGELFTNQFKNGINEITGDISTGVWKTTTHTPGSRTTTHTPGSTTHSRNKTNHTHSRIKNNHTHSRNKNNHTHSKIKNIKRIKLINNVLFNATPI